MASGCFAMFAIRCIILISVTLQGINYCLTETTSNIHVMRKEIAKALENCGYAVDYRQAAREEFERRVSSVRVERSVYDKDKTYDESNSEEWDYGDYYRRSSNDRADNKSVNNDAYPRGRHGDNNSNSSWQSQNSSKNRDGGVNNFDSRGGRYSPILRSNSGDGKEYRSVKDLNFTANLYDPYMTRGIRSTYTQRRTKRFDKLVKSSADNECLSQCVFTDLEIIDERGIPKEAMFMKYIEDNISSQQSKVILQGQIQACFKELASESEENSCSYSNALDRCMDLQLKKRKSLANESTPNPKEI